MRKVLACGSGLMKTDASGRRYRWHCGWYVGNGQYAIYPSRYYEATGLMYEETEKGLRLVDENV